MNFIKLNKEEYEINYTNFKDQYVVIDNSLIYNGEIAETYPAQISNVFVVYLFYVVIT